MSATEDIVEKAIADIDESAPAKESTEKADTEDKKDKNDASESDTDEKDDEGFDANEVDASKETPKSPEKASTETHEIDTTNLDAEVKFIVDNLPYISARIKDGDTVKEIKVKSWTQLPDDLEFASKRDEIAFMNALTAQENRATALQQQFKQKSQDTQAKQFEEAENQAIRDDIARLQKTGELPKFKYKIDDERFDSDPATKEVQKVMDYMNDRNTQYLKEYEQGRPYRHIGFEEAYTMYRRNNPKKSDDQAKEDKERKESADKVGGNRGLTANGLKKPTVHQGTRVEDILNRIEQEW